MSDDERKAVRGRLKAAAGKYSDYGRSVSYTHLLQRTVGTGAVGFA